MTQLRIESLMRPVEPGPKIQAEERPPVEEVERFSYPALVPGVELMTAICGKVRISEFYPNSMEARRDGYYVDCHAYRLNRFGAIEVPPYKIMAKDENNTRIYCVIMGE